LLKSTGNLCPPDHNRLWQGVFARFPEAVGVAQGGVFRYANPKFADCFGYEDGATIAGMPLSDLLQSWSAGRGGAGGEVKGEAIGRRADGSEFFLEISEAPMEVSGAPWRVLVVRDLSERRRRDQQYRDAQKMQVVGRLVGGIVHDFNNLLTAVMIYSGMLLARVRQGSRQEHYASEILRASERGAALAGQLLALARQQPAQPQQIDLGAWLVSKRELLQRLVGEQVRVKVTRETQVELVNMDPAQLDQVLLNLVANARDAMPHGGTLAIEVTNREVTPSLAKSHLGLLPGSYVMLTVSDSGCGMDEATRTHLFEPFFTTKEQGKGTGLGLTTVYGILAQSGGRIYVESEVGKGTVVEIFLPTVISQPPGGKDLDLRAEPCILLVEDEELVRSSLKETLEGAGYCVLSAESGARAVRLAGENAGRLNALITDIVMPGMNGREVAEKVLQLRPELPVIYISGYTAESQLEQMRSQGAVCLQKPFPTQVLVDVVQEATSAWAS
jgi:PAS domain S-box-containing protein